MRKGTKVVLPNGTEAKLIEVDQSIPHRERAIVQVEGKSRPTIETLHRVVPASEK